MSLPLGNRSVIGIDIDANSINIVQSISHQGQQRITNIIIEKIQPIKDISKDVSIIEALKSALSKVNTKDADVVCTISDPKLFVDHITLPKMPLVEILQAVKLQIGNTQHYPIDNPAYDFQILGGIMDKGVEKHNVMVAVLAKASLDSFIKRFKSSVSDPIGQLRKILQVESLMDLNITRVIPPAMAISHVIGNSKEAKTVAVLYMGSANSELNIYRSVILESSRKLSVNGADFTKALTSAIFSDSGKIELTVPEALSLRKEHGIPLPSDQFLIRGKITANQAVSLLRPKVEQLCKEIHRCFDVYNDRHQGKKIEKVILLGDAALIKRLDEVLSAEMGIPVVVGNPLLGIDATIDPSIDTSIIQNGDIAQSLTLAAGASLVDPAVGINLLPDHWRNIQKKFVQMALMILSAGIAFILSVVLCLILMHQNNLSKAALNKARSEYQVLLPQANLLKDQLMIDALVSGRLNFGNLLMQLSYAPQEIVFTELKTEGEVLSLSGLVHARTKEAKELLERLIQDLMKDSLYDVKVDSFKKSLTQGPASEFVIKAQLNEKQGLK